MLASIFVKGDVHKSPLAAGLIGWTGNAFCRDDVVDDDDEDDKLVHSNLGWCIGLLLLLLSILLWLPSDKLVLVVVASGVVPRLL